MTGAGVHAAPASSAMGSYLAAAVSGEGLQRAALTVYERVGESLEPRPSFIQGLLSEAASTGLIDPIYGTLSLEQAKRLGKVFTPIRIASALMTLTYRAIRSEGMGMPSLIDMEIGLLIRSIRALHFGGRFRLVGKADVEKVRDRFASSGGGRQYFLDGHPCDYSETMLAIGAEQMPGQKVAYLMMLIAAFEVGAILPQPPSPAMAFMYEHFSNLERPSGFGVVTPRALLCPAVGQPPSRGPLRYALGTATPKAAHGCVWRGGVGRGGQDHDDAAP